MRKPSWQIARQDEHPDYYDDRIDDDSEELTFKSNGHTDYCVCPKCQQLIKSEREEVCIVPVAKE
jgi:hypothetical protein